jgi:hypothetical protein
MTPPPARSLFDGWRPLREVFERAGVSEMTIEIVRDAYYVGAANAYALLGAASVAADGEQLAAIEAELRGFRFDMRQLDPSD